MKRLVAFLLVAVMLATCVTALAASWYCPNCGTSNSGNFCSNCGTAKPAQTRTTTSSSSVQAGQYIYFGNWEQNGHANDGTERIEWLVLEVSGGKALVMSRYGLHRSTFNSNSAGQTWENCDLREWLNNTFYYGAFSSSERNAIQNTYVDESVSQTSSEFPAKRIGSSTVDKIYLLSYAEMVRYLPNKRDRMCIPTSKAIDEGCNKSNKAMLNGYKTCWYWLRTPAYNNNAVVVDWDGTIATCYMNHTYGVVRPVCWVELSAIGY